MLQRTLITSLLSSNICLNSEITVDKDTTTITDINDISNIKSNQVTSTLIINDDTSSQWPQTASTSYFKFKKLVINCKSLSEFTALKVNDPSGTLTDYYFEYLEQVTLPDNIHTIRGEAFKNSPIKTINLENITTLSVNAFTNCHYLEKLTITATQIPLAFAQNCPMLTEVILTNENVDMQSMAFMYCSSLSKIDFTKISSIGESAFSYTGFTSIEFPSLVIGQSAFAYTPLNKVTFSADVTINGNAFEGTKIQSVSIAITSSNPTLSFANCFMLQDATITSEGDFTIPSGCFSGCHALKNVNCENATSVSDNAFYDCINLTTINGKKITSYGKSALENCENLVITINSSSTSFSSRSFVNCRKLVLTELTDHKADYAFLGCTSITKLQLEESVSTYMFAACTSLESIEIGEGCDEIKENAFANCTKLSSIKFNHPETVSIATDAFANTLSLVNLDLENVSVTGYPFRNSGLQTVSIGANVITVTFNQRTDEYEPQFIFNQCDNIEKVTIKKNVEFFIPQSFLFLDKATIEFEGNNPNLTNKNGIIYDNDGKIIFVTPDCEETSLTFSKESDTIDDGALYYNKNIKEIKISKFMTGVSFQFAKHIKEVTINYDNYSNPTSIPALCFAGCISLKKLTIENAVESIGNQAFMFCKSLTDVTLLERMIFGEQAFSFCTSLKSIKIPLFSEDADSLFMGCISLKEVEFHPFQSTISDRMFMMTGFKKFTVPGSINSIGDGAFGFCQKLSKFELSKESYEFMELDSSIGDWFSSDADENIDLSNLDSQVLFYFSHLDIDPNDFNAKVNTNFTFVISSTVSAIRANTFSKFAYVDVEIDKENIFFKVDGNCIINKLTNELVATFGVLDRSFKISSDVEFIRTEIYPGKAHVFKDANDKTFDNDIQARQLKIPSSVKEISQNINSIEDIRSICYDGKYFNGDVSGNTPAYVSKKYIYPTFLDNVRNTKCQSNYLDKDKARHRIGMTGPEIGLTVGLVIVTVLLVIAIILYILLPFSKLVLKAAAAAAAP